ncbi:two-component system sensor histidine kinase QseC [Escherichia coli]|uniref:two-component system sensor histidine kinase QseC n=1 Tax=Escherichia coli TaxID=562 RepID=UPI000CD2D8DD|nr:two-component system sensor histidine kinase QseC [Escherichia coli]EEV9031786.1 two-component system sensor histidine kinase QseC [Escherichia coli]EFA6988037.1 two-component system sensor histidine kinase QseC [Escherichia coli]EFB6855374.1 two-component system sensor histidine kinase QseC [Escherichia coli]EFH5566563.1 two-component system sensor histidine kinase QseC [Escherichia coli]EFN5115673.1 two-component system sensor histidine kinase QseC [Escherichia coli]
MKFTQRLSLRVRLTLIFLILASVTWLLSSFVAWKQTTDNVDELFDTQLMLFAKRLSTLDLNEINAADRMAQTPNKLKHGHVDDDALTFAIFTHDGRMVLNDGDNGEDIPYSYQREGFADGQLVGDKDQWRFVWMTSPDGKYRIVVGQEWEYREDMALAIVAGQLIPWLVALPIMLIIMMVLLGRELAPLNKLFARTHAMMVRERRFTSDAAHELRSPLTALKVQTEVAQLSDDDPQARKKALLQLHYGIDRATRLVDQLLTLSRLDSLDNLQDVAEIPLEDLLQSSVMDIYHTAQQAKIDVRLTLNAHGIKRTGQPLLLSLLVRNLLDNAVRYSPQGSVIDVTLNADNFIVRDNGPGVTPEALARIGERFYRPPGQTATGSGLGLSIVQRIAKLHGMNVEFGNAEQGGFEAKVSW